MFLITQGRTDMVCCKQWVVIVLKTECHHNTYTKREQILVIWLPSVKYSTSQPSWRRIKQFQRQTLHTIRCMYCSNQLLRVTSNLSTCYKSVPCLSKIRKEDLERTNANISSIWTRQDSCTSTCTSRLTVLITSYITQRWFTALAHSKALAVVVAYEIYIEEDKVGLN